ncbi:hypothetical protein TNCT_523251 [Trichonephila clavata]|uniref:Uncharacterized protein n=1 Tax=Trichonephila clavata TaxID=2740835 RepID=A0A8X6J5L1_TRICU|nr:hypothetical protein TNCT_523251 [Trichonephila clavata]
MRITANIIDEDPYAFTVTSSEINQGEKSIKAESNWFFYKNCIKNERRRKDCFEIEKVESTIENSKNSNQNQKVKEVTQKFKNLHLSDALALYDYSSPTFEVVSCYF